MRSYVIDEITTKDLERVKGFLDKNAGASGVENLYWVEMPEDLLSGLQCRHEGCRPYVFAVELGTGSMKAEFFIRTLTSLRCDCQAYATPRQCAFIMDFSLKVIKDLDIRT